MTSIAEIWNTLLGWFQSLRTIEQIGLLTLTLALLTFVINYIIKPLTRKRRLKVSIGMSYVFVETLPLGKVTVQSPIVTCTIVNKGIQAVSVNKPLICTSHKIKGNKTFGVLTADRFPVRLEHGETYTFTCQVVALERDILFYLPPLSSIKFLVTTTTGKKYKSNSLQVYEIRRAIHSARNLS